MHNNAHSRPETHLQNAPYFISAVYPPDKISKMALKMQAFYQSLNERKKIARGSPGDLLHAVPANDRVLIITKPPVPCKNFFSYNIKN